MRWCGFVLMLLFMICGGAVYAQNVTIRANNGSCLASTPEGPNGVEYDTFYQVGGFATWQHEQLAMVLTASDNTDLTINGQLANPANNIFTSDDKIQIAKGFTDFPTCYLSLTLPKGFRFTGYSIVFSKISETKKNNLDDDTRVSFNHDLYETRFGETNSTFDTYINSATVVRNASNSISRNSMSNTDMGNVLYFKLENTESNTMNRALITLESAEFYFTAEADYTPEAVPVAVNCVSAIDIPFHTSKVDYGNIVPRTYNNAIRKSYDSNNVQDLTANLTLYEAESLTDGSNFDGSTGKVVDYKSGSISVEGDYIRIGSEDASNPGTEEHIYYLETPSYVLLSDNTTKNPIGYRIVGADISYKYGPTNLYSGTSVTGTTTGGYTLKVYDKEGSNPEEVEVTSDNASGTLSLSGLNNDAIKIGVVGTGLIQVALTLQALNPYVDHLSVVCEDKTYEQSIRYEQAFVASDFRLNGDGVYINLPDDCYGNQVVITFEDLISKYADESYTGGSSQHNSRYSFVKSYHYNAFTNGSDNNVYNNPVEAKEASEERIAVDVSGTERFKFNNASDLSTSDGILTEYPFSLSNYANAPNNGQFKWTSCVVTNDDKQLTRYLFTTDETRYNIAPTTAIQHRSYAFYELNLHVKSQTYSPTVQFVPIYKDALYSDNGQRTVGDFYGAVVTADTGGEKGYASTDKIYKIIDDAIKGRGAGDAIPDSPDKILYLDMSGLAGVYETRTAALPSTDVFAHKFSPNCMIFMPAGQAATIDNTAYMTGSGQFHATNNIVLTDEQPFYSPYDIQMDADRYVRYERQLTSDKNGKVSKASVILPFAISVDANGQHTNVGESSPSFSLHQMQSTNCLSDKGVEEPGETFVFFPAISAVGNVTTANTPYLVNVLNPPADNNLSFVVTQNGTTIKSTTDMDATTYNYSGESASGSSAIGSSGVVNYSFSCYANYSGSRLDRDIGTFFYYANNKFLSSDQLADTYPTVYQYPFRVYYTATKSYNVKGISSMSVVLSEGNGEITGIDDTSDSTGLTVTSGRGYVAITAGAGQRVQVFSLSGVKILDDMMNAGDMRTFDFPPGIYIVNGSKVIIR